MIPQNIIKAMHKQTAPLIKRSAKETPKISLALAKLGIPEEAQLSQFLFGYMLPDRERENADELNDIIRPYEVIYETTQWARSFGLPEDYITLTSGEGEGFYLYNKDDKKIYDVELGQPWQNMIAGKLEARWNSFYEFLEWYLEIE